VIDQMGALDDRVAGLEKLVRSLNTDQYRSVGRLTKNGDALEYWPPTERFGFSGSAGVRLDREERRASRQLWTRLQAAVAKGVAGVDVEDVTDWKRASWIPSVLRDYMVRNDIEGRAATALERTLGRDAWCPMIGIWNACCAALLAERLNPRLRSSLEHSWASALGVTPRERLGIK
jgi:hypothetical protein